MFKRNYFYFSLMITILFLVQSLQAQENIIISELCDPQDNYQTDRFIEIYNPGNAQVDLSGWSLVAIGNGSDVFTWNLSGTIDPGEALVAGNTTTVSGFYVDFGDAGWNASGSSGGAYTWNGKNGDGAKLIDPEDNIIDYVEMPSSLSSTFENRDYVRNSDILLPNSSYDESEWSAYAVSTAADASPGTHTITKPIGNPNIKNITYSPENPVDGDSIIVSAVIIDTVSTVTSAILYWDTDSEELNNAITLISVNDSTYVTEEAIPAQAGGVDIYYSITAINNIQDTASSAVMSFHISRALTISEIQGAGSESPYSGEEIITAGIVTGIYPGGYATIQDGLGARQGIWVSIEDGLETGYSVRLRGVVIENDTKGFGGTTLITETTILDTIETDATMYSPVVLTISEAVSEDYEGMLIIIDDAVCTDASGEEWEVTDGSGSGFVDDLSFVYEPVLGTTYSVTGAVVDFSGEYFIEPRGESDVIWKADNNPPQIDNVVVINGTSIEVSFSELLSDESTGETSNFLIDGTAAVSSSIMGDSTGVMLTVNELSEGNHELIISGVEDLYGNAIVSDTAGFYYLISDAPAGYYDPAANLKGQELRQALHDIIDDHTSISYSAIWNAFYSTDAKDNGKVWDIYSDTPGEDPPYEYEFGTDQAGSGGGGVEGDSYNREHTWPKSWFGGEVPPMYTDLFIVYPTDSRVNSLRNNNPYGEVDSPTWTSLNGSKMGPCSYPGYTGTVFEPIDEYKGDLARTYFYVTTRYYGEDGDWPGSDMVDGANLKEWALNMLLEWSEEDPVSQKEIARNNAIYEIQNNRNPFIDHPDFIEALYDTTTTAVEEETPVDYEWQLTQNYPNPFNPATTIGYNVASTANVTLKVYDILGREVMTLVNETQSAGSYLVKFNASELASGIYVYRLSAGEFNAVKKMILLK